MKKVLVGGLCALMVVGATSAFAGTKAGDKQVGLQFAYDRMTVDDSSNSSVILIGTFGYFVTNRISMGLTATANTQIPEQGDTSSSVFAELEPNFHFNTASTILPYAGIHAGMAVSESSGKSNSAFDYGAQVGLKSFISESAAFDTQLRYTRYSYESLDFADLRLQVGLDLFF